MFQLPILGIPCVFVKVIVVGKEKAFDRTPTSDSEATTAPATHPNQLGQHQHHQ